MTTLEVTSNPFADPNLADSSDISQQLAEEATLTVGRNASLTLGTDSLVVLGISEASWTS